MITTRNRPIEIADVLVSINGSKSETFGEYAYFNPNAMSKDRTERIGDLVELITLIVDQQHELTRSSQSILERKTYIKRIITPEFLFYTKSPLTESEFQKICSKLEDVFSYTERNLIGIFSSFAVLNTNGTLSNKVISINDSEKLKISEKLTHDLADPKYALHTFEESHNKTSNKVIRCTTLGQQSFFMPVSICLEAHFRVADLTVTNKFIKYISQKKALPTKISHVITSNSITLEDDNFSPINMREAMVQVDRKSSKYSVPAKGATVVRVDVDLDLKEFCQKPRVKEILKEYPDLTIVKTDNIISIKNPPFAKDISISFYPSYQLEDLPKDLSDIVSEYETGKESPEIINKLLNTLYKLQYDYCKLLFDEAIECNFLSIVMNLIINPLLKTQITAYGDSVLHYLIRHKYYQELEETLASKVSPDLCDGTGYTPAHYAAVKRDLKSLSLLKDYNANFALVDNNGRTPLGYAIQLKHWNTILFLLMHTKDISQQDKTNLVKLPDFKFNLSQLFLEELNKLDEPKAKSFLKEYHDDQIALSSVIGIINPVEMLKLQCSLTFNYNRDLNLLSKLMKYWNEFEVKTIKLKM